MRHLRRKLTLKAHGAQVVFVKQKQERRAHVLMKAFLWALYLPTYPDLSVEITVGDRYKPDVVSLDARRGTPRFWGEAGKVGPDKLAALLRRYPRTHFAMSKWATNLEPYAEMVREAGNGTARHASFDLIRFPADSEARFVDEKGRICISHADVEWRRIGNES